MVATFIKIVFLLAICTVTVTAECTPGEARLVNGTQKDGGVLEICTASSVWSTVCSRYFYCDEKKVACKQAGYDEVLYNYGNYTAWLLNKPQLGFYSCNGQETSLSDCNKRTSSFYTLETCSSIVALVCRNTSEPNCNTEYDVRLVGGKTKSEGQLQICRNKRWRDVCDNNYAHSQAIGQVVCRQLGYTGKWITTTHNRHYYNSSYIPDLYSHVTCYSGEETYKNISFCSVHEYNCPYCKGSEVAIQCEHEKSNCKDRELRLVGGRNALEGFVEICINKVWGKMSGQIQGRAKDVICSSMGYNETGATDRSGWHANRYFTSTNSPVVAKYINCCDRDRSFQTCDVHWVKSTKKQGRYYSYLALQCIDGCTNNAVRLIGGNTTDEGIVEMCVGGVWRTIGLNQWDDIDANVVCQKLYPNKKYAYAVATNSSVFDFPTRYPYYDYLRCNGAESSIAYCSKNGVSLNIYTGPVAAVHCHPLCDCSAAK